MENDLSHKEREKPIVLTIAGFDPSSGAGLTADIRTFENIGIYGLAVCTAVTIQNAEKVAEWMPISKDYIEKQMEILFNSYKIKVVKTGMLPNADVIKIIADFKNKYGFDLIVDPVTISSSGKRLANIGVEEAMKDVLFPITTIITPNKHEAEYFSNKTITDIFSVEEVAKEISKLGAENVIIKGGHIGENENTVIDYLYTKEFFRFYPRERVITDKNANVHGTGCVFSSLIAGFYAHGYNVEEAILFSEDYMEDYFKKIIPMKAGMVLDVGYSLEELDVLHAVQKISDFICGNPEFTRFIPEVRMNISVSKPNAKTINDVAGIDGRITIVSNIPVASGPIRFGKSNHTARLLLAAKQFDNSINVVVNLKYSPETILKLSRTQLKIFKVDRHKQSEDVMKIENSTMSWIIKYTIDQINQIPDIIFDVGEPEKEPMIRLFAKNSDEMIKKLKLIISLYKKGAESKRPE